MKIILDPPRFDCRRRTSRRLLSFLLVLMMSVAMGPGAMAQESAEPTSVPGSEVILKDDPRYLPYRVPLPPALGSHAPDSVDRVPFAVNFNPSTCEGPTVPWPNNARDALNYAASIWSVLVHGYQTIEIDACWESGMAAGVLGSSRVNDFYDRGDFDEAPLPNTLYAVALANQLSNHDMNGDTAEMRLRYNSTYSWYFGLDGETPANQHDFVTVVLHEIAHGLGFSGSMRVDDGAGGVECNGTAGIGCRSDPPWVFDRFAVNQVGVHLVTAFSNSSNTLAAQLTGGNLFFDGPRANAANGGNPPRLYAPNVWDPGSSFSHLDDNTFDGTPHAQLTHAIARGESAHYPGEVALGILADIGWSFPSLANVFVSGSVSNSGNGHYLAPFRTVTEGVNAVNTGGTVWIQPYNYPESMIVERQMTIRASGNLVTIGR